MSAHSGAVDMNRALVWRTIQNSTWLIGGLILLGSAFFLWIGIQVHQHIVVEKPVDQGDVPVEPEKVRFSSTLGMMTDVVPPLDLSQITTSSSTHTAEFRGADYVKAQSNRWYLHVMNVTKAEVIESYLANRTDRDKFTYFRYLEPKQPERYILAYGSFPTVSKALDASKSIQFDLPDSVKVYPERFSELKKFVNDEVAADLEITNLGGANRLYQVKLRSVPVPVPVEQPTQTASSSRNGNSLIDQPSTISNAIVNNTPSNAASGNNGPATAIQGALTANQPAGRSSQSSSGVPASNSQTTPNNSGSTGSKSQTVPPKPTSNATNSVPLTTDASVEKPRPIADPFN